ncbi:amidohydrolase family protein [Hymenobacter seoulensis]
MISHVNVVDVTGERVLPNQTVVVLDGCIVSVGTRLPVGRAVQRVDGRGKYLIPGLWDSHSHALASAAEDRHALPLYVAHGITSIRVINSGRTRPDLQATIRAVEAGQRLGPRIELAGASLDGPLPFTSAQGKAWATSQLQDGWRALQSAAGLSLEAYLGIAEISRAWRAPLVGPIPQSVTAQLALEAGHKVVEPADHLLLACTSQEADLVRPPSQRRTAAKPGTLPVHRRPSGQAITFQSSRCTQLGQALAKATTYVVPLLRASAPPPTATAGADSLLARLVPAGVWGQWKQARQNRPAPAEHRLVDSLRKAMVAEFQRQGVALLAGSDAGWATPFSLPGRSLLDELEQLVGAGLTPSQALQSATVLPAAATGHRYDQGKVEVDFHGDLVLLDGNPLEDIRNLRQIRAVVLRGRLLDREALGALITEAEKLARQSPAESAAAR